MFCMFGGIITEGFDCFLALELEDRGIFTGSIKASDCAIAGLLGSGFMGSRRAS